MKRLNLKIRPITCVIGGSIGFWILFFIHMQVWVRYCDRLSRVINILMIVVMVFASLCLVESILQGMRSPKKNIVWLLVILLLAYGHVGIYRTSHDRAYEFGGSISIVDKREEGDTYYFYVRTMEESLVEIACDEATYQALLVHEEVTYSLSYRSLSKGKGCLGGIDLKNYIDNRP